MRSIIKKIKTLASVKLLLALTLWLMVLLILGTIEQKSIGLLASQQKYFFSTYFKVGPLILPGGGITIFVFTLSLLIQLIFKSHLLNRKKIGINLAHIGTLIMFLGAFITHIWGTEGSLIFKEGETKNYFYNAQKRSLYLKNSTNDMDIISIKLDQNTDNRFSNIKYYPDCKLTNNMSPSDYEVGFARVFKFQEIQQSDDSLKCVEFNFESKLYRIFESMPKRQTILLNNVQYYFELSYENIQMPFQVKLIDFQKQFHQGTMVSKSFKSIVTIIDNNIETKHSIEMNMPLRYKGYTFYQSSFSENSDGESSELTVVKNDAAIIPYISTILLFFGLLLHFLINFRNYFYEK